jgi:UV excision repair protein RAD23
LSPNIFKGIPDNVREAPAPRAAAPATPAPANPPATTTPAATVQTPAEPTSEEQPFNMFEAAAQQATTQRPAAGGDAARSPTSAAAAAGSLDFLRDNPQFQQLRQLIQQQPSMLEPILHQLGAANPQLLQLVNQNPEEFLDMLSGQGEEDAVLPPGAQTVQVTEEERDAIERVSTVPVL